MKQFLDRAITGFFVFVFGLLWVFSTQYYFKQKKFRIAIYDIYGKEIEQDQIRTEFSTPEVTRSYIKEYQKNFPHMSFSIKTEFPEMKRQMIFNKILKKDHK